MIQAKDRARLLRVFLLLLGLVLLFQIQRQPVTAAPPIQTASVSIVMDNPTCAEVLPESGACKIEVRSLVASGSDPSFSRIELLLDGKLRVLVGGFFESSAYLTDQMVPGGIQVACGSPNASGRPNYGKSYLVTANAYMANGASASDSMTVFCPAYDGKMYIPVLDK